jgi:hypothetical protein
MFWLHFQGLIILALQSLKMMALCSFKALGLTSPKVQHYIPEDLNQQVLVLFG